MGAGRVGMHNGGRCLGQTMEAVQTVGDAQGPLVPSGVCAALFVFLRAMVRCGGLRRGSTE